MNRYLGPQGSILGGPRKGWRDAYAKTKCDDSACVRCKHRAQGRTCSPTCLGWRIAETLERTVVPCNACGLFTAEQLPAVRARQARVSRFDTAVRRIVDVTGVVIVAYDVDACLYVVAGVEPFDHDECGTSADPCPCGRDGLRLVYDVSDGMPGERSECENYDTFGEAMAAFSRISQEGWR